MRIFAVIFMASLAAPVSANFVPVMPVSRTIVNVDVIRVQPTTFGSHGAYMGGCGGIIGGCGGGYRQAYSMPPYYQPSYDGGYSMSCGHRHFPGFRCHHRGRCCRRRAFSFGFGFRSFGFGFGFNFARF